MGPTGVARVEVTFASSGEVTDAGFADPGSLGGTAVGECILEKFRQLRMPPFEGKAVHVKKAIQVQ